MIPHQYRFKSKSSHLLSTNSATWRSPSPWPRDSSTSSASWTRPTRPRNGPDPGSNPVLHSRNHLQMSFTWVGIKLSVFWRAPLEDINWNPFLLKKIQMVAPSPKTKNSATVSVLLLRATVLLWVKLPWKSFFRGIWDFGNRIRVSSPILEGLVSRLQLPSRQERVPNCWLGPSGWRWATNCPELGTTRTEPHFVNSSENWIRFSRESLVEKFFWKFMSDS